MDNLVFLQLFRACLWHNLASVYSEIVLSYVFQVCLPWVVTKLTPTSLSIRLGHDWPPYAFYDRQLKFRQFRCCIIKINIFVQLSVSVNAFDTHHGDIIMWLERSSTARLSCLSISFWWAIWKDNLWWTIANKFIGPVLDLKNFFNANKFAKKFDIEIVNL